MNVTHVVQPGDTLSELAWSWWGESRLFPVLAAVNELPDPDVLVPGTVLIVPDLGTRTVHELRAGESLRDVAASTYEDPGKWVLLAAANGLDDPDSASAGRLLWLPDLVSEVGGDGAAPATTEVPEASARHLLKGTLVPIDSVRLRDGTPLRTREADGLHKLAAIRQFSLAPGDVAAVRRAGSVSEDVLGVLEGFERGGLALQRPGVGSVVGLPDRELKDFADGLARVRQTRLQDALQHDVQDADVGQRVVELNAALVGALGLSHRAPLGMLNLERLEMVPVGIQRGELVATIPMAPGESTAVTHKEWSVGSQEFTRIVVDEFEDVSERGVVDSTDLSSSTSSQSQHSNQFNVTATVQGGIPLISGSSTGGFTAQDGGSVSAGESTKHARSLTEKASARSRQEHRTTISTRTETGNSEVSTRTLRNTGSVPVRVDYFSMMRQWRVRLYRYGLRLTYDLVVPEPGAAMRRAFAELERLRAQQGPFEFPHTLSGLDGFVDGNGIPVAAGSFGAIPTYLWLADRYRVVVPTFPAVPPVVVADKHVSGSMGWLYEDLEFTVPDGAEIAQVQVTVHIGHNEDDEDIVVKLLGSDFEHTSNAPAMVYTDVPANSGGIPYLAGQTGNQKVTFFLHHTAAPFLRVRVVTRNTAATVEKWRADVATRLVDAAQTRYYEEQRDVAAQIAALEQRLLDVDTLTLRREEGDEVMKSVLRFVLGPEFAFMPQAVRDVFAGVSAGDVTHGTVFDAPDLGINQAQWTLVEQYEDVVRFVNQAIEWESVVTFLYSYFWDTPAAWRFVRDLRHPDATRQAFLRAGAARVVLTIRRGWEERWMRFVQGLDNDQAPSSAQDDAYLTIAQEIAAYDDRNYPGIPPANPGKTATRMQESEASTCADLVGPSAVPVEVRVAGTAGFVTGRRVVVDVQDDRRIQESVLVLEVLDGTSLRLERLDHAHDGTTVPFPVLQPGEKGVLIAEWDEYTPSSGTDIAMTSNLVTVR